jgi:sulfate permease, SulP family
LLASLVLYALFGTSRQLVVVGTSASALLVYSSVSALHPKGAAAFESLAAELIVLTGVLFVCSGLLRLGFITQFLSRPVMEGFVFGIAVFITVSQLPKLFGLAKGPGDTIEQFVHLVAHLGSASWATFAVGAVALALLFGLDRVRRVPSGLVVLVAAIVVSTVLHLDRHGVDTGTVLNVAVPSISRALVGPPSSTATMGSVPAERAGGHRLGQERGDVADCVVARGGGHRRLRAGQLREQASVVRRGICRGFRVGPPTGFSG